MWRGSRVLLRFADTAVKPYDLRDFVRWIVEDFEPTVRVPGGAGHYARTPGGELELYGTSDMACIFYTLGRLHPSEAERAQWADAFAQFQHPDTGYLLERSQPTHAPLHNTAFALAAMRLLDLSPKYPLKMASEFSDPRAFLGTLDWKKAVYTESHKGAGIGSIFALAPELAPPGWFARVFCHLRQPVRSEQRFDGEGKTGGRRFRSGRRHISLQFSLQLFQSPHAISEAAD